MDIPLRPHRVTIEFDVLASGTEEAAFLVYEALPPRAVGAPPPEGDPTAQTSARVQDWHHVAGGPRPREIQVMPPGWDLFEGSGIPEMVAEMFPPSPELQDFRQPDGAFDQDAFDAADDAWRSTVLDLAVSASRLPTILERLTETERVRDGLIDTLHRLPLPVPPDRGEYHTASGDARARAMQEADYRRDTELWRTDFVDIVLRRDAALNGLLASGGPRTTFLPDSFHHEWLPADLLAVQTLRALVDSDAGGRLATRLLGRADRQQLSAMLAAADLNVRVPDPDYPAAAPIYEGPASEAHQWIPDGVYPATDPFGYGDLRLVVGRALVGDAVTASAVFPTVEHDSAAMNAIAAVLEDAEEHAPADVVARLRDIVAGTGRSASDEGAPGVSGLLRERERDLGTPGSEPGEHPGAAGPTGRFR